MSPHSVFITGCNRGIGLELVRQFLKSKQPPTHLFATCRDPTAATDLNELAQANPNLHVVQLDVTDNDQYPRVVETVSKVVEDAGLNLLINNAGIYPTQGRVLDELTPEHMRNTFEVNCVAPLFLTRSFLPLLKIAASKESGKGLCVGRAAAIQMSTILASITETESMGGKGYAYRSSKAALNMVMKTLSIDLKEHGILTMAMHPGWVSTDMGGPNAMIDTQTCVSNMLTTLDGLSEKDHGAFLAYNNKPIQW